MKNFSATKMFLLYTSLALTVFISCKNYFPIETDFSTDSYPLFTQDNKSVKFPEFVKGKLVVVEYIFTNCPDICPLTTNNMRLVQEKLNAEKIKNVSFVSISFDPETDTPDILKKFASLRNLDLNNWSFLAGDKKITNQLIKKAGVFAIPSDTSKTPSAEEIVFFVHTDRILIMDEQGNNSKKFLLCILHLCGLISCST
jgi:protein SCO1/2